MLYGLHTAEFMPALSISATCSGLALAVTAMIGIWLARTGCSPLASCSEALIARHAVIPYMQSAAGSRQYRRNDGYVHYRHLNIHSKKIKIS